ncbi:CarD family transcriptional regulator [Eubacterium barkeri]|uniref:Transcriptional regulator, CarD family n=1 Tax=Eubacterium barkeri TaxID=1528 RepID=A0A1H3H4X9_EUBBA|nr:CarD family transcriptional regulator [Eubacterium barkeri]SDY10380.1 transcriptional regulator, CarD family [Eubacterium barkeri]
MYDIGDKIVYPMHGAGVVKAIEEKELFDECQWYYLMEIVSEGMEILIPVDKADEIGVRPIVSLERINIMLSALEGPMDEMLSNWTKRYQNNLELLKKGDLIDVAHVVRNLTLMDRKKGLSSGEKKMLVTAKNFLVSEMVVVCGKTKKEADSVIEDRINA